jgi:hypothetical protein
VRVTVVVVE